MPPKPRPPARQSGGKSSFRERMNLKASISEDELRKNASHIEDILSGRSSSNTTTQVQPAHAPPLPLPLPTPLPPGLPASQTQLSISPSSRALREHTSTLASLPSLPLRQLEEQILPSANDLVLRAKEMRRRALELQHEQAVRIYEKKVSEAEPVFAYRRRFAQQCKMVSPEEVQKFMTEKLSMFPLLERHQEVLLAREESRRIAVCLASELTEKLSVERKQEEKLVARVPYFTLIAECVAFACSASDDVFFKLDRKIPWSQMEELRQQRQLLREERNRKQKELEAWWEKASLREKLLSITRPSMTAWFLDCLAVGRRLQADERQVLDKMYTTRKDAFLCSITEGPLPIPEVPWHVCDISLDVCMRLAIPERGLVEEVPAEVLVHYDRDADKVRQCLGLLGPNRLSAFMAEWRREVQMSEEERLREIGIFKPVMPLELQRLRQELGSETIVARMSDTTVQPT